MSIISSSSIKADHELGAPLQRQPAGACMHRLVRSVHRQGRRGFRAAVSRASWHMPARAACTLPLRAWWPPAHRQSAHNTGTSPHLCARAPSLHPLPPRTAPLAGCCYCRGSTRASACVVHVYTQHAYARMLMNAHTHAHACTHTHNTHTHACTQTHAPQELGLLLLLPGCRTARAARMAAACEGV